MSEHYFFSLEGPLDSLPARHQMRTANLSGFPALVRNLGRTFFGSMLAALLGAGTFGRETIV